MDLFRRLKDYPFPERPSASAVAKAVAEVCVVDGVERIAEAVVGVESGSAQDVMEAIGGV